MRTLAVAVGLSVLLATGCGGRPPESKPNVILVVIDTLRQDHLGCYGHTRNTTPRIDEFATGAVRFDNAYSQAPWTIPSFASILTSLYPSTHGVTEKSDRLDDSFQLLPEVLKQNGFDTGAVISHYFLRAKWNLDQGFDVYDESSIVGHRGVSGPHTTQVALDLVDQRSDRPFFLMVHYFDPHYDYIEHEGYLETTDLDYSGPVSSGMIFQDLKDIIGELTETDLEYLRRLYDSEIAFTDAQIGTLLDGLESRGLFDDSLVIITADHGEEFRERKTVGHGGTLYNELIKIPLVIKLPHSRQTGIVDTNVGLIDLYPTILDLLEISIDHEIAGVSMLDDTGSLAPRPRPIFSETDWNKFRAVIDGRHKLIRKLDGGFLWFFNLERNPGELKGRLNRKRPDVWSEKARNLADRLADWTAKAEVGQVAADSVEMTDEERTQLEALGYLD